MEEYIAPKRKRIPYGMMNFAVIRRDDCYYVDKNRFIPMIEDVDKFFFFIRPRRFGKSLTVNLFINEYDHFTNAIFADPESLHRYTNETHGEGYLRAFFNKVKAGTYSSIERCFITGVSPVTMDDLTSGFNIGTNYSLSPKFNEMIGFTEEEVRQM